MRRTLTVLSALLIAGCSKAPEPEPTAPPVADHSREVEPPKETNRNNPAWNKAYTLMGHALLDIHRPKNERILTPEETLTMADESDRLFRKAFEEGAVSEPDFWAYPQMNAETRALALKEKAEAEAPAKKSLDELAEILKTLPAGTMVNDQGKVIGKAPVMSAPSMEAPRAPSMEWPTALPQAVAPAPGTTSPGFAPPAPGS